MRRPRLVGALAACAISASCHYKPPPPQPKGSVRTATEHDVETCLYVGNFVASYGLSGLAWAQMDIENLAVAHGATDVVWGPLLQTTLSGKAYKCP